MSDNGTVGSNGAAPHGGGRDVPFAQPDTETLADTRPYTMASAFLREAGMADVVTAVAGDGTDKPTSVVPTKLRHWREDFYQYCGNVYRKQETEDLSSRIVKFLNRQTYFAQGREVKPLRVTNSMTNNVMGQVRAICQAHVDVMPAWLDGEDRPDASRVVAFSNGLLDLDEWLADEDVKPEPPTHHWFSMTVLPRPFVKTAECPGIIAFLHDVLEDGDQVALFQEWAGLLLTRDTSFQKMMWFHGVGGGGKGTSGKLLTELVGRDNVASFGLFDLTDRFTLSSFVGKTVAISHDAHLGNTTDSHRVIEHLLAISGEDDRLIDRKNREILQGVRLATRLIIATNGFPQLPDAGIALRRRSLILSFAKTFESRPDTGLFQKLMREMPGFTLWAMRGLRRLMENGFTKTARGGEMLERLGRLSSPVRSFVEDCCEVDPKDTPIEEQHRELKRIMYEVWEHWQKKHGHRQMSFNTFSERLYEAFPTVHSGRPTMPGKPGEKNRREHTFEGIRILDEFKEKLPEETLHMTKKEMDDLRTVSV